jgi:hypothetical protein
VKVGYSIGIVLHQALLQTVKACYTFIFIEVHSLEYEIFGGIHKESSEALATYENEAFVGGCSGKGI